MEPHVITARGAQPKSVIDNAMPVEDTKLFSAGPKASVSKEIMALVPVNATAIRNPPSIALGIGALKAIAKMVKTINIIAAPPRPIKELNNISKVSII